MRILALDVATNVGICVGESGADPRAWSVYLGDPPDERRFSNALSMAHGLIENHNPDLIVVEAAIGGPKTSHYLVGLVACVRGCAYNRGVQVKSAALGTVRKHFLGKAIATRDFPHLKQAAAKKAIKAEVMKRCALLGWPVDTDDEADAVAIWDWACAEFVRGHHAKPAGGLFYE